MEGLATSASLFGQPFNLGMITCLSEKVTCLQGHAPKTSLHPMSCILPFFFFRFHFFFGDARGMWWVGEYVYNHHWLTQNEYELYEIVILKLKL